MRLTSQLLAVSAVLLIVGCEAEPPDTFVGPSPLSAETFASPAPPVPTPPRPMTAFMKWVEQLAQSQGIDVTVEASRPGLDVRNLSFALSPVPGSTKPCPPNTIAFRNGFTGEATIDGTGPFVPGLDAVVRGNTAIYVNAIRLEIDFDAQIAGRQMRMTQRVRVPEFSATGCEATWTGTATIP